MLVVEGEVTERDYFQYVKRALRDSLLVVEVSPESGEPLRVVEAAVKAKARAALDARRRRDENLQFDEVWCVVDVDEHARLADALQLARRNGVEVAVSNPCFELWVLLHFADQRGFMTAQDACARLQAQLGNYEKHLDCTTLVGKYADAMRRAQGLVRMHEGNGSQEGANPSTDVWRVTEALLSAAASSGGRVAAVAL